MDPDRIRADRRKESEKEECRLGLEAGQVKKAGGGVGQTGPLRPESAPFSPRFGVSHRCL